MEDSGAIAKQNYTIRNRYSAIIEKIVNDQGTPLCEVKSELKKVLVCQIYHLGYSRALGDGQVLSPEELFRVCLYSLNVDLRNYRKIDQNKALELYKCVPGADNAVTSMPTMESEVYRTGEDIINQHSVISTKIRAIILGYSVKVSLDPDVDFNDNHNGTHVIIISSDSEEDQLDDSQSRDDDFDPRYVKEEEFLF